MLVVQCKEDNCVKAVTYENNVMKERCTRHQDIVNLEQDIREAEEIIEFLNNQIHFEGNSKVISNWMIAQINFLEQDVKFFNQVLENKKNGVEDKVIDGLKWE